MKKLFSFGTTILLILGSITVHLSIINLFPYPFNYINILFVIMIWPLIFSEKKRLLTLAVPLTFFMELFSSAPFGINIVSIICSLIFVRWLLLNLFTNRSIYIVFLAGLFVTITYRLLFMLFLFGASLIQHHNNFSFSIFLFINALWSSFLTAVLLVLAYTMMSIYRRRFNPGYIIPRK